MGASSSPLEISVTTSGTPHHVTHNLGYWHVNDMDELYLRLPGETPDALGYSLVIMGNPSGDECDRFAWYCERCLTILSSAFAKLAGSASTCFGNPSPSGRR